AEQDAEQDRGHEERPARHRFDDLEVAEPAGHLHRADRPKDDQQVTGDPGDCDEEDERLQQPGEIAHGDQRLTARERAVPGPFCRLHCQPAAADQRSHQETGADEVQPAPVGACHAVTPRAVSQPSTSARYASSAFGLVASNRMTSTGCVFEARSNPHPSGNVMRTPSSVETGYFAANSSAACWTTSNFCSSGQSTRISGVAYVFGRSESRRDRGPPSRATYANSRAAAKSASSNPYQSPPKNM